MKYYINKVNRQMHHIIKHDKENNTIYGYNFYRHEWLIIGYGNNITNPDFEEITEQEAFVILL